MLNVRLQLFSWRYVTASHSFSFVELVYIYIYILKALVCWIFQEKKLVAEIKKTAKTGNEVSLFCGALIYWMFLLCKYRVWNLMETFGRGWVDFLLTYLLEFLKFASWCFMWYILVWTLNIFFFLELHDAMNVRMPKIRHFWFLFWSWFFIDLFV